MFFDYYGRPMPPPMMGNYYGQPRRKKKGNSRKQEAIRLAMSILRDQREKKKKDAEKNKPKTFTFLETWGILMLGAIPFTMIQLLLLQQIQVLLNNAFNGTAN